MIKHTRGPWRAESKRNNGFAISTEGGLYIGRVAQHGIDTPTHFECEPNARLVAAAPDLLEALDRAHLEIIKLLNEGDFKRHVVLDLGYIVDAIAKAEGKTNESPE
jgi:hypothetical protein